MYCNPMLLKPNFFFLTFDSKEAIVLDVSTYLEDGDASKFLDILSSKYFT